MDLVGRFKRLCLHLRSRLCRIAVQACSSSRWITPSIVSLAQRALAANVLSLCSDMQTIATAKGLNSCTGQSCFWVREMVMCESSWEETPRNAATLCMVSIHPTSPYTPQPHPWCRCPNSHSNCGHDSAFYMSITYIVWCRTSNHSLEHRKNLKILQLLFVATTEAGLTLPKAAVATGSSRLVNA